MNLELDRKSWHYRLAVNYTKKDEMELKDVCTYTRQVLAGAVFAAIIAIVAGGAGGAIASFLAWLVVSLEYKFFFPEDPWSIVGFSLIFAFGLVTIIYHIERWRSDRKYAKRQARREYFDAYYKEHGYYPDDPQAKQAKVVKESKPWFIVEAYKAFKNKYCLRVNFK